MSVVQDTHTGFERKFVTLKDENEMHGESRKHARWT